MIEFTSPHFVKICGVTTLGDAFGAIQVGADAIGLNIATSPRRISVDQALAIAEACSGQVRRVLVVRDNDDVEIESAAELVKPDAVQVHGVLSAQLLRSLRARRIDVIKVLVIASDEFYGFDDALVDAVMIDGASPGSGLDHSWAELAERPFSVPLIGAGGLDASNVGAVIAAQPLWGVDSASGVESSPGVKDRDKVAQFVTNARLAFHARVNT